MDENDKLNEQLADGDHCRPERRILGHDSPAPPGPNQRTDMDLCQWQVSPNKVFRPAARTTKHLVPGMYTVLQDQYGPFLQGLAPMSDQIVTLPESANIRVLDGIRKFWTSRERYQAHGLVFKRGVLLWGPPGGGKTVTVHLLTRDLIESGGIVVFCSEPAVTAFMLGAVRRIERSRPLIVVYEDIDEIVGKYGEHEILSMLDGEHQTDNVVSIATTNYPDRLGARIVNRPSRFDDRIFVGMPSHAARLAYLENAAAGSGVAAKWASETEGLSIAHLRELVAAVICLDGDYSDVLKRLRSMNERPKEVDGYRRGATGFAVGERSLT